MKDWIGNTQSSHVTMGSRNYAIGERQNQDYYATHPKAIEMLLEIETFDKNIPIWECACGAGDLAKVLVEKGYSVKSTDLFDRGYGKTGIDFLDITNQKWEGNIVTNPPFKYSLEFIEKGLSIISDDCKLALFLPIRYLEGVSRGKIFRKHPPITVHIPSRRLKCAMNGKFDEIKGNAMSFSWFVWRKGFTGNTILKWFN